MPVLDKNGNPIYRLTEMTMEVQSVEQQDLLFGIPIQVSEPQSDFIWRVEAWTEDEDAGIQLLMTMGRPITVQRWVLLKEDQCVTCGRTGVKYAARHQCSACYQKEHRAARKPSSSVQMALSLTG